MLGFKNLEGEYLLLKNDTRVTFVLENPFFDPDNIIVSPRTYQFTVPDDSEGHNRRLLGFTGNISTHGAEQVTPFWVMLNKNEWMLGDLVSEYKDGDFECYWNQYQQLIDEDLEASLTNVDTGVTILNANIYDGIRDRVLDDWAGERDFVHYPVKNPKLYNNDNSVWHGYNLNNFLPEDFCEIVNYWTSGSGLPGFDVGQFYFPMINPVQDEVQLYLPMSPGIYLKFMVQKLFDYLEILINPCPFLEDDDIEKLTIWTNKIWVLRERGNYPHGGDYTIQCATQGNILRNFSLNDYIPDMPIKSLLEGIKKNFCLTFYWDFERKRISILTNSSIVNDHDGEDWTDKLVRIKEILRNTEDGYLLKTTLSDDELFTTRIKSLENKTEITAVDSYADLVAASTVALGSICLVKDEQKYYYTKANQSSAAWEYYSDNYPPYKVDNGGLEIASPADTLLRLFSEVQPDYDSQDPIEWTIPESLEANDSVFTGMENKDENLRLLFYRGMQYFNLYDFQGEGAPEEENYQYPYATHCELGPDGTVIGTYSLAWPGDNGLYNKWWKPYINFRKNSKPCVAELKLNEDDLLKLKLWKSKFITEKGSSTQEFIIKTLSVDISVNEIAIAEAEIYNK